jgi:hypothetical protein
MLCKNSSSAVRKLYPRRTVVRGTCASSRVGAVDSQGVIPGLSLSLGKLAMSLLILHGSLVITASSLAGVCQFVGVLQTLMT